MSSVLSERTSDQIKSESLFHSTPKFEISFRLTTDRKKLLKNISFRSVSTTCLTSGII